MTPQESADKAAMLLRNSGMVRDEIAFASDGYAMAIILGGAVLKADWKIAPDASLSHAMVASPRSGEAVLMASSTLGISAAMVESDSAVRLNGLTPVAAEYLRVISELVPRGDVAVLWSDAIGSGESALPVLYAQCGAWVRVVVAARTDAPRSIIMPYRRL